MLICLEETVLISRLVGLLTCQFPISLKGLLSGLPILCDRRLGAEYAFEHLHVIFGYSLTLLSHSLLVHGPSGTLIAVAASVFPEGRLRALVNLSQFRADLVIGSAMLIPIKWRQAMCDGGMGRMWHAGGECGLGSEQFPVVVPGEQLGLEGFLGHKLQQQCVGSFPLQQTVHPLSDLALGLGEVQSLYALVELLDVCIFSVFLEVEQGLDNLDQISLLASFESVHCLAQLEFVAVDGLADKILPVVAVNFLNIEFSLDFSRTILDILLVCAYLSQDHLQIGACDFLDLPVFGAIGEFCEIWVQFQDVIPAADIGVEAFHIMVGLLGDDEESDAVVGVEIIEGVDERSHVLEDEHDVVTSVQVQLLVSIQCSRDLLLLLILLPQFLQIYCRFLLCHDLQQWLQNLLPHCVALGIDEIFVDFDLTIIEIAVIVDSQFGGEAVDDLLCLFDDGMIIDFLPADTLLGVNCQASFDEVMRLRGEIDA